MKLLFFPCLGFNQSKLQKQLAGKTVLITGASYGIGEYLAESLAETDAHLILVARTAFVMNFLTLLSVNLTKNHCEDVCAWSV